MTQRPSGEPAGANAKLRPALAVAGVVAARYAQSARLPLVAAFCLAVAVATLADIIGSKYKVRLSVSYPKGFPWYVGDTVDLGVSIKNDGAMTIPLSTLLMSSPLLDVSPAAVPELRRGETVMLTQRVFLHARRGEAPMQLSVRPHHRLVGRSAKLSLKVNSSGPLPAVRPQPVPPPVQIVRLMTMTSDEGVGTGRRGGTDPLSLRQFAAGDPVASVHWRSTARAGRPVVLEREQVTAGVLVLLVASHAVSLDWERAVARAAGLVQAAAFASVPVQIVTAAPAVAPAGVLAHDAAQIWLAGLDDAGLAQADLVERAVRTAAGGLIGVLSVEPWLPGVLVEAGARAESVVDLFNASW